MPDVNSASGLDCVSGLVLFETFKSSPEVNFRNPDNIPPSVLAGCCEEETLSEERKGGFISLLNEGSSAGFSN